MENKEELGILNIDYTEYITRLSSKYKNRKPFNSAPAGQIISFIPGTIVELLVREGDKVRKGQELLVLEAMKMKNRILSSLEGKVRYLPVKPGDKIAKGALLVEIEDI